MIHTDQLLPATGDLAAHVQEEKLPDEAFAAIYHRVRSRNGRTTREKVRRFPIHNEHSVKNARAALDADQEVPAGVRARAHQKIVAAAKKYGLGVD